MLQYTTTDKMPLFDVTPPQAAVLIAGYINLVGTNPISEVCITGEVERSNGQELERLQQLYPSLRVKKDGKDVNVVSMLFPGLGASLPKTFEELELKCNGKEIKRETYRPDGANTKPLEPVTPPAEGELPPVDDIIP